MTKHGKAKKLAPPPPPESLAPYKAKDIVIEVIGGPGSIKRDTVSIVKNNDTYCWTSTGNRYDRISGMASPKTTTYAAIHTPDYEPIVNQSNELTPGDPLKT